MNTESSEHQEETRVRQQLQRAMRQTEVPPHLEMRIRAGIRVERREGFRPPRWLAVAAAVAVVAGASLTIAYQLGQLRITTASQESYVASVSQRVVSIMRVGLRDHIHCAVFRKYPKTAPLLQEVAAELDPKHHGLLTAVREQVPPDYQVLMAHECRYKGREYLHLALRRESRLLSVVVAAKQNGERFADSGLVPAMTQAGVLVYTSDVQRFRIAAFESQKHLVYVISDLPGRQNLEMMARLSQGLHQFLGKLES